MSLQGRVPLLLISQVLRSNVIVADNAVFHFVKAHQPAKFIGLVSLAFANHYGVFLKQTEELIRIMRLALEDARLSLSDDSLTQGPKITQLLLTQDHPPHPLNHAH